MSLLPVQPSSTSVTFHLGSTTSPRAGPLGSSPSMLAMFFRPAQGTWDCAQGRRGGFMHRCGNLLAQRQLGSLQNERQCLESRKTQLNKEVADLYAAQAHLKKIGASKHKAQWSANGVAIRQRQEELKKIDERLGKIDDRVQGIESYRAGFNDAMAGSRHGGGLWSLLGQFSTGMGWNMSRLSGALGRLFG